MVITFELINSVTTPRGGFTRKTLEALGVSWPPKSGWRYRLRGKHITDEAYAAAKAGAVSKPRYEPDDYRPSVFNDIVEMDSHLDTIAEEIRRAKSHDEQAEL